MATGPITITERARVVAAEVGAPSGLLPPRTADPGEAARLLAIAGACILKWHSIEKWATVDAGMAVLGRRLHVRWDPRTIRPHPVPSRRRQIDYKRRVILEATGPGPGLRVEPSAPSPEGWGLGDARPDLLTHLCAHGPTEGGQSYVVDGYAELDRLADTQEGRQIREGLLSLPVLQQAQAGRPPRRVTLARRTPAGRLCLSHYPSSVLLTREGGADSLEDRRDAATECAQQWHQRVIEAAAIAPRFDLSPGDVLILDNYRVFAGRDGYLGERVVHRGWFWSEAALAYPMVARRESEADTSTDPQGDTDEPAG